MKSIPANEGLNNLILSQILNEDIYIIQEKKEAPENTSVKINVAAKTEKKGPDKDVVIVLDKTAKAEEHEFLIKILSALKMTVQDVSIINKEDFSSQMEFKNLIAFNINPQALLPGINTEKYIIKEHGKAGFLYADSLDELIKDVKKKKQLWEALQLMFLKK
jgi:hypothetical protein